MIPQRGLACLLALLAIALPSCGADAHEEMSEEMIALMAEVADVLEGVSDKPSAEAAAPKLEQLGQQAQELTRRAEALGEPGPEKEKEIQQKVEKRKQEISKSIGASMMRIASDPEALQIVSEAMIDIE